MSRRGPKRPLADFRSEIDRLDHDLVALLARRMELVREIGDLKRGDPAAPLRDEAREREVFEVWARRAREQGLSPYFVGRVLREVLNYSRRDQERLLDRGETEVGPAPVRVGYQGMPGSYSDLTITKLFESRAAARLERIGFRGFSAAVDALEAGQVTYALLPIENTVAGSINEVYDLLSHRSLTIVGEEVWPVEHCLLGLPGATLEALEVIRSHPVALQQCGRFLSGLVGTRLETYFDTAGAAQSVAQEEDPRIGAIASEEAGRNWGLEVLRRDVADQRVNLTRFLLIGTRPEPVDPRQPSKTSLVLVVRHRPGALLECLRVFDDHRINLTKLESRPVPEMPWVYRFFVDLEGHAEAEPVASALARVRRLTTYLKVLGAYARRTGSEPVEEAVSETAERGADGHEDRAPERALGAVRAGKRGATEDAAEGQPAGNRAAEGESAESRAAGSPASAGMARRDLAPRGIAAGTPLPPAPASTGRAGVAAASAERLTVRVGRVEIGGGDVVLLAGPGRLEGRRQLMTAAAELREAGGRILCAGAGSLESSAALELLISVAHAYEMAAVADVRRPEEVRELAGRVELLRVAAVDLDHHALLDELGHRPVPVLLERAGGVPLAELARAARRVQDGGNHQVILCERGIRTFEIATPATVDLAAVPLLQQLTGLPVLVDPTAAGRRDLVRPLALAAVAAGADGLVLDLAPAAPAPLSGAELHGEPSGGERVGDSGRTKPPGGSARAELAGEPAGAELTGSELAALAREIQAHAALRGPGSTSP